MGMEGRRTGLQIAIGVAVMLLPMVGFPYNWEAVAQYLFGAAIIVLALPFSISELAKALVSRPRTCPPTAPASSYGHPGEENRG